MTIQLSTPTAPAIRTRPPRSLEVVWQPAPEDIGAKVDWSSWYLTDEADMGESGEQHLIIRALISYLTELAWERNWQDVLIGADQFFAWVKHEPLVRVSPDVYLLDHPPPRPLPASWQTWLPGQRAPRLAFEIVSAGNWRKDYRDTPAKYAQLGTQELVIFDPDAAVGRTTKASKRVALQIFHREVDSGFTKLYEGLGPARCRELDAWLVILRDRQSANLGIARDAQGQDLVPSVEQAREHERIVREREQIARKQAEQSKKQEQIARKKAEDRAIRLAEQLRELGIDPDANG